MLRSFVFSIATASLVAAALDVPGAVAQEYRVTVRDLERRLSELVKLNEQLAETLEQREKAMAARIEALEAANQQLGQHPDSFLSLQAQVDLVVEMRGDDQQVVQSLQKTVMNLQGQAAEIDSRLKRLEGQRSAETVAGEPDGDRSSLQWIPPSEQYGGLHEYRGPRAMAYRNRMYRDFETFKKSSDYLLYLEENRQAAERFNEHLREQEHRYEAAGEVLLHRREHMLRKIAYQEQ